MPTLLTTTTTRPPHAHCYHAARRFEIDNTVSVVRRCCTCPDVRITPDPYATAVAS